ncbi:hypothetical protein KW787_00350 [Candidatus Pacearchaeota archaeon]|nr:hypothetical protein [Candidatus Pacearchaeota archaeon]
MVWKDWPYWLKGGIIFAIIGFVSGCVLSQNDTFVLSGSSDVVWIVYMAISLTIVGFIVGTILGSIYGSIKNKEK